MKQEIFNIIDIFGLIMDYDQWDVEGKGWIRVLAPDWVKVDSTDYKKYGVTIIYKDDVKQINDAIEELQNFHLRIGEYIFKKKIRELIL
jgi:hypothetical protein